MMKEHCQRWPHPISLAVGGDGIDAETIRNEISDMGCREIDVSAISNVTREEDYPINALRNLAMAQVKTSHVVYIDMDFVVSPGTYEDLMRHRASLRKTPKMALVLPAFQLGGLRANLWPVAPTGKTEAQQLYLTKDFFFLGTSVTPFDLPNNNLHGHDSTNFTGWFEQPSDTLEALTCLTSDRFEPFLVVRYCRDTPPFPEAFIGYGRNKMVWVQLLHRLGWELWRVGQSFVTHLPHYQSTPKSVWWAKQRRYIQPPATRLSREFAWWMEETVVDQRIIPYCPEIAHIAWLA